MSTLLLVLTAFLFNNGGPQDVLPVAALLILLWASLACGYVLLSPDPQPLFFGVPAHRAHWSRQSFPRKWIALAALALLFWAMMRGLS